MTPLKKFGQTRAIEGHVLNENLWPNVQLDVIGYRVLLQNLLKTEGPYLSQLLMLFDIFPPKILQ